MLCCILDRTTALIFKEMSNNSKSCFRSYYNTKYLSNEHWNVEFFRHATESEKSQLFCQMKEKGYLWNAEKKKVERIRWRAKKKENYHFINTDLTIIQTTESEDDTDESRYNALNYFRTKEYTAEAARRVRKTLREYHEEIGE